MRDRFLRYGGEVVRNAEVTKINVDRGRAVGVQVHDQLVQARRAVLADVAAEHLYGQLVTFDELPPKVRVRMAGFPPRSRPSKSTTHSAARCRGARRRRTPRGPCISAIPMRSWSSAAPS